MENLVFAGMSANLSAWGNEGDKVHSVENPELTDVLPLKAGVGQDVQTPTLR